MVGSPQTPMADEKTLGVEREIDDDDASASDQLLPGEPHSHRSPNGHDDGRQGPRKGRGLSASPPYHAQTPTSYWRRNWKWIIPLGLALFLVIIAVFFGPSANIPSSQQRKPSNTNPSEQHVSVSGFSGARNKITFLNGTQFVRPPELKIIGILFYGRRQFVKILDCYLQRNLKLNGGMLDEIHFLMHTDVRKDIKWLKRHVKKHHLQDHYILKNEETTGKFQKWSTFPKLYEAFMTDPDAIYIKMDDDLLFIDDYAIAEMVRATLEHPEAHNIQANIVNNRWNQWHHLRAMAVWPYLPEETSQGSKKHRKGSWRASELPPYNGSIPAKHFVFAERKYKPPRDGHRWLPLDPTYENLGRTPYGGRLRNPDVKERQGEASVWAVAAQSHFSFFQNYENHELWRYNYGNFQHVWNQWYSRYNINMMAIRGSQVLKEPVIWSKRYMHKSDELLLTKLIPKIQDMPAYVATRAIAAHYSFRSSRQELLQTDVLDRYKALAKELYCRGGNRKHGSGNHNGSPSYNQDESDDNDDEIGDGPQDIWNMEGEEDDADDGSEEGDSKSYRH